MARKRTKGDDVHGWLVLDKPAGLTSTQALGRARRLLNANKAGHVGTLDPLATGILPLAFGEATKTAPFLEGAHKTYRFTIEWGRATNTLDAEGRTTAESDFRPVEAAIQAALPSFVGTIEQTPPAFSAIKIDGVRAYALARAGEDLEMQPRPVDIFDLRLIGLPDADHAVLEMRCGSGTYVRSLARDLAARLGAEGHVSQLRRVAVGPFGEAQSVTMDVLEDLAHKARSLDALKPVQTALDDIPALAITGEEAFKLKQGRSIVLLPRQAQELKARARPRSVGGKDASRWALALLDEEPVALGDARAGKLTPLRVFNL